MSAFDGDVRLKVRLARLCEQNGKLDTAVRIYRQLLLDDSIGRSEKAVLQLSFNLAQALVQLWKSNAEKHAGQVEEIVRLFEKCHSLDCTLADVYINAGGFLIAAQDSEQSLEWSRNGLSTVQDTANSDQLLSLVTNLNVAMRQLGRLKEAVQLTWSYLRLPIPVGPNIANAHSPPLQLTRVVCVKHGTKYSAQYVNNLYAMMRRCCLEHAEAVPAFVCYTEDPSGLHQDIAVESFPAELSSMNGWWAKMAIFAPVECSSIDSGWSLYLDLDTVLLQSVHRLTQLADTSSSFYTLDASRFVNESRPMGINSSIMLWPTNSLVWLYDYFQAHHSRIRDVVFKFDHWLEMQWMGNSTSLEPVGFLQHLLPQSSKIIDYHEYCDRVRNSIANDSSVFAVCFPLHPKPHELVTATATTEEANRKLVTAWQEGSC